MSHATSTKICPSHRWERRLETHDGVECVVRVCPDCGHKELAWSRQGLRPAVTAAFRDEKKKTTGRDMADD